MANTACGIVGLPTVGKTSIFNAMTGSKAERHSYVAGSSEPNLAEIDVPDERLDVLARHIPTQRIVPAKVKVVDIAGLAEGASRGHGMGNKFLGHVKETDALMHVVQCFERAGTGRTTPVNPALDLEVLERELALADLETVTRNVERVGKKARAGEKEALFQKDVFERARKLLEDGVHLATETWSQAEEEALRPLFLLTIKPVLYVANVGDDDFAGTGAHASAVRTHASARGAPWIAICGDMECELAALSAEERQPFMADLGIEQVARPRSIRAVQALLGLQTFFTAGEKEIKAWTIRRGDSAPVAAGKIHSDFEKGFVRAEIYSVDDLVRQGSESAIRQVGKLRLEGKGYVMQEGDVCHFLVNR
jgi:GTP-binding protein YchF